MAVEEQISKEKDDAGEFRKYKVFHLDELPSSEVECSGDRGLVFVTGSALEQKLESRSEEHTSELQSHSFISYAVFCLKKKK